MGNNIILKTDRLLLRRYQPCDLQDLYAYLSDAEVVKFEPYQPMTLKEAEENLAWRIISKEMIAIELRESGRMIGNVYLGERDFETLEIGYVLNRSFWGAGYAREGCEALIGQAFARGGIHRIYAECDPENTASWRLLERLGFQREAHFKQNVYFWRNEKGEPIWKDTYVYARLAAQEK